MKAPTKAERELLDLVLREVRHVAATKEQLQIVVDPFTLGGGAYLGFHYNGAGWQAEINGELRAKRKRARRAAGRRRR